MRKTAVIFDPGPLHGRVAVAGDKSISHRALIAGARSTTPLRIANLNPGRDVRATREALGALGVRISKEGDGFVVTRARLASPAATLDCMNSGSTVRMLLGVTAGANVGARFDGDASLRRRPMEPVAAQLRAFGAKIETTQGHLPIALYGTPAIETRHFILLSPSAQVKSALLFAGLFAGVAVAVDGDRGSRDHTERLLRYLGAEIEWNGREVKLGTGSIRGGEVTVAGDFSAAAFFITAAAITPGSSLLARDVGVNPTRTGLLDALRAMGAGLELHNIRDSYGEPIADIEVEQRPLHPVAVTPDVALRAIDEIPLLAIAAAFAAGTSSLSGIGELLVKESDRIAAIKRMLDAVGIDSSYERGILTVFGGRPAARVATVETQGDHRIAMATAVLGCAAGPLGIDAVDSIEVSFPGFVEVLRAVRGC